MGCEELFRGTPRPNLGLPAKVVKLVLERTTPRRDPGPQPPLRRRRTQPRRPGPDRHPQKPWRLGRAGSGPLHRRRKRPRCPSPSAACSRCAPPLQRADSQELHQALDSNSTSSLIESTVLPNQNQSLEQQMARVCQVTGKAPMVGKQRFPRQQQDQAPLPAEPAKPQSSGARPRTVGYACASPTLPCAPLTKGIDAVVAELRARGEKV